MKDKTGFFAGVSDALCSVCIYWVVAATMVMADRGWSLGLFWPVLWTLLCSLVAALLLKKPRSFGAMMLLAVGEGLLGLALFIFICGPRSMTMLYVLTLCVGAGMASGLPLYYSVKRPQVHSHLSCLDMLILAFLWLLLVQTGRQTFYGANLFMTAALIFSAATAVGLRMGAGNGREGVKAMAVALISALAVAAAVFILTALFSRSGQLTGRVIHAVGSFFAAIGDAITRFFEMLAGWLARPEETMEAISVEVYMPDTAGISTAVNEEASGSKWPAIVLGAILLAALAAMALLLRKTKVTLDADLLIPENGVHTSRIRRSGFWARLRRDLRFRLTALLHRDTPPGLYVLLQRKAARRRQARRPEESPRHFIRRMAPDGRLDELCDDLDRHWYGGQKYCLSASRCRELRQRIKAL